MVHEVSFPGNTFKLASTCSIVSGDVVARQRTEANDASARFFYKEACLCKRSKTPSTEKHRPYRKNSHLTQRQYVALLPHKQQNTTGYGSVKNALLYDYQPLMKTFWTLNENSVLSASITVSLLSVGTEIIVQSSLHKRAAVLSIFSRAFAHDRIPVQYFRARPLTMYSS